MKERIGFLGRHTRPMSITPALEFGVMFSKKKEKKNEKKNKTTEPTTRETVAVVWAENVTT